MPLIGDLRFQCCGWNNVLDIAIVAIFIYYVLVLIRGTRAVQLLLGVLILVGIYGLAVSLHLQVTQIVLQAVFVFGLTAIVVVFQPELRRALSQLGQLGPLKRLLAPLPEEEVEHIVDELVRSALLISEAKHGALVVVERATGLQDYSETGVPVNGKLTAELLASIFMTRSPLHDGAVIVRGESICGASLCTTCRSRPPRCSSRSSSGSHRYRMRRRARSSCRSTVACRSRSPRSRTATSCEGTSAMSRSPCADLRASSTGSRSRTCARRSTSPVSTPDRPSPTTRRCSS